jgi:hypothetical protein
LALPPIAGKQGLMASLLAEMNRQLSIQGLYIRAGKISNMDASAIQAQSNRPKKDKDGNNTQDPEVSKIYTTNAGVTSRWVWVAGILIEPYAK